MADRILFVAGTGNTLRQFVAPLARSLSQDGYETIAAAGALGPLEGFDRQYELPPFRRQGLSSVLRAQARLIEITRREKPDLLHLHTPPAVVLGRMASAIAGVPSVAVIHTTFLHKFGHRAVIFASVETALARLSTVTITLNEEDAHFYRRIARRGAVVKAPVGGMGLDFARLRSAARAPQNLEGSPSIVVVGRLTPEKNLDLVVDAYLKVRDQEALATLWFVGSATFGDTPWAVPDIPGVHHIPWADDPYPLIAGANVLVSGSPREGFPMVVAEAIALGTRVVSVSNRGVREISRHVVDGLCLCGPEAAELADAILASSHLTRTGTKLDILEQSWSVAAAISFHRRAIESAVAEHARDRGRFIRGIRRRK